MAKERVALYRNTGTEAAPVWEKWFAKTVYDAVMMSDGDGEGKNIKQYVDDRIALLIGGAPETGDTLKELFDLISGNKSLVDALNAAIANKADKNHDHADVTASAHGFMSKGDKAKLDGIATGANNYVHPASGAAAGTYKSVTVDAQGHVTGGTNPTTLAGYGITDAAAKSHSHASMGAASASAAGTAGFVPAPAAGSQGKYLRGDGTWETPANTTYADMKGATASAAGTHGLVPAPAAGNNSKYLRGDGTWQTPTNTTYSKATSAADGLMAKEDKVKLDGVATGANNYTHPSSHPASMIAQDATHRMVSDAEKIAWNGKASVYFSEALPGNAPVGALCFLI